MFRKILYLLIIPLLSMGENKLPDSLKNTVVHQENQGNLLKKYNKLGNAYSEKGDFAQAIVCFQKAVIIGTQKSDFNIVAFEYNEIGNAHADEGNNAKAFAFYQKALKIIPDSALSLRAKIYKNIGALYLSWKNFDRALSYYELAQGYALKAGDRRTAADCLNNKGTVYEQKFQYKQAFNVYQEALKFYLSEKLNDRICLTYNNLAILSKVTKHFKQSSNYYKEAALYADKAHNVWLFTAITNNLGNLLSEIGDPECKSYLLKALVSAQKIKAGELVTATLESLASNAERNHNYREAYNYLKQFSKAQNEFINLENTKEVARLQEQFDAVSRDKKIEGLSKENTIQKLTISRRNIIIGIIGAILLISIFIAILLFNQAKLKQKNVLQHEVFHQQDLAMKSVIEAQEKERVRIGNDLHDGIGQMFSAVKMSLSALQSDLIYTTEHSESRFVKVLSLVDESCREVRSISHQMAPQVLFELGLEDAVKGFIQKVDEKCLRINVHISGLESQRLEPNVEIVLFRVIQEAVNNTIKHAAATVLDIQIVKDLDGLSVMIEDDGLGFNIQHIKSDQGIGMKNMQSRISYLKGSLQIDSSSGKGTAISIWIP